ncbi:MAG: SNF2-related protein [Candidatus Omnitrophica bacterium]|nr:SNF2-related protein [Candidatus Omnitrophota bacterium]
MAFITNRGNENLGKRLKELIERSGEIKILTGFFYFSGIQELYDTLKKLDESGKLNKEFIKILVGLEVDEGINGLYEYRKVSKIYNINLLKDDFLASLKKAFNSHELDKKEVYEQAEFFIKLLEEGKIIIKKTKEPTHAKLYLFKLQDNITPSLFITGSSNLTKAGLISQNELNVEIKDFGFDEAEKFFDNFWTTSIELEPDDIKKTLQQETLLKKVTPFIAWAYLLKLYIDLHTGIVSEDKEYIKYLLEKSGYKPYNYEIEAILQAKRVIEIHNGVLLSDVTGLGKTIIACIVAKLLKKRGIVICPPHLIGDENKEYGWKKYLEDFKLHEWEVRSIGKLNEVLDFVNKHKDIEVVIIDEGHRFRNENTERFHYLHEICRGKLVIILTATPFNNRPSDIFSLLKLFTIPKKSTIVLDEDLKNRFDWYESLFRKLSYIKNYYKSKDKQKRERAEKYYNEIFGDKKIEISKVQNQARQLAKTIRSILEPVVIRRNRLDLKNYGEEIDISEVKDPKERFFELTKEQSNFYDEVIETFLDIDNGGKFTGAIYIPIKYEKGSLSDDEIEKLPPEENFMYVFQRNLYDFMRRLLVKRFESSFGAFEESINHFTNIHESALKFIDKTKKFILNRKLMKEILELEDDEEILKRLKEYEEELEKGELDSKYHKIYEIDKFKFKDKFLDDLKKDKQLFEDILKKFQDLKLKENDPKVEELIKCIEEFLKDRKVVIFTEYIDTAKYLEEKLDKFKDIILPAYGNLNKSTINAIYENFDAQYEKQKDQYKILLATDKLSEGFNLNRAGVVINYDIPWNPVRVIQRVGRINRIAKKVYDEIYIVNFFPTEKGADIVKSREIAQNKMFMIHKVLGEDAKIFSPDEEPQPAQLYRRLTEYREEEEESFFTKVRKEFEKIKKEYPDVIKEIENMPYRIKVAKNGEKDEVFVFIKKENDIFIGYKDYNEKMPEVVSFDEIFDKVKVENKDEKSLPLSENFWQNYYQIIEEKEFKKLHLPKGIDTSERAKNLLKSLIDIEQLKPYQNFISTIIDDIQYFGTLSEYILGEIADWEKYYKDGIWEIDKIIEKIENLKDEIGENFLEKAQKYLKDKKETVIIAIENRKNA